MSKWREWGRQGGRPRTRETIEIDGIRMSIVPEQRGGNIYYYGVYTDANGKKQRKYLGTDITHLQIERN